MHRRLALGLTALIVLVAPAAAGATDPRRWELTGMTTLPREYWQGVAHTGSGLAFAGPDEGLYRTLPSLREAARRPQGIRPDVAASERFNHIGDLEADPGEGGRLILPLECYYPFSGTGPDPDNPCGYGAFGVADPVTLEWRYHVRLDQSEIAKAMWVALEPPSGLLWTQSGADLLAYRSADLVAGAAPLRAVRRLAGVAPDQLDGAAWLDGRLYASTQGSGSAPVQLWSFDLATGARQLEYERRLVGESEGLAAYAGDGGTLHWVIAPGASTSPPPTFGTATSVLLHLEPRGNTAPVGRGQRLSRVRLTVTPARVRAGRRVTLRAVAQATIVGRTAPAEGVRVAVRGVTGYTDARGRATVRIRVPRRGRLVVRASRPGLSPSQVALRVRR